MADDKWHMVCITNLEGAELSGRRGIKWKRWKCLSAVNAPAVLNPQLANHSDDTDGTRAQRMPQRLAIGGVCGEAARAAVGFDLV